MVARRVSTAAVLFALACAACKVYDPDLVQRREPDAGQRCELDRPPLRPPGSDDGEDVGELVYALKDVVLNQDGERWRTIGYDLDGLCSIGPMPPVECRPPSRTAAPETDGEGGIDNAFGHHLYPLVAVTLPTLEEDARASEELGIGAIVVRIRGWNGEPNDPRVDAMLLIGQAGTEGPADGSRPAVDDSGTELLLPDGSSAPPPAWEGNDWFWARSDSFFDGDEARPLLRDDNAYVSDNLLVAQLPERADILFQATEQAVLVRLTEGIAVARFVDGGARLEAHVAGRWPILDILQTAARVGICPGSTEYNLVAGQLDRIADIRQNAGTGGPDVTCDAMSLGAAFTGYPAHFGGVLEATDIPNACEDPPDPDGGVDAGSEDAGLPDAGVDGGPEDAGPSDAGVDGGPEDAGPPDAGPEDASPGDADTVGGG